MPKFTRNCDWCHEEFETEWETKLYCTRRHKENAREYRKRFREGRIRKVHKPQCPVCGITFESTRKDKVYCSKTCSQWLREQRRREIKKKKWKASNAPLLRARIFYRDKGLCQLCHEPIDLRVTWPDPMSMSIDHKIPRSKGGTHTIDNLQSAHLSCNSHRGDKDLVSVDIDSDSPTG
jgi:5-methylcytosine-specific restriction endonuclease McrA